MSKIYDALRAADARQRRILEPSSEDAWANDRPFRVVTVTSNKGGVGKTTVASNLAVYLRALRESLPVLLVGFDDQTTLDRMFAIDTPPEGEDVSRALREGTFQGVSRLGQYGVHFVPSSRDAGELKRRIENTTDLRRILLRTAWQGIVLFDTKSDFEILTQAAIEASDEVIVVVKDQASLIEAKRVFDLLAKRGRPPETARILLSLVDLRVKFREGEDLDVLSHLLSEVRREGYPLFESFLSRSPKVESLTTNPDRRALSILQGARQSVAHRQMQQLAEEVLKYVQVPEITEPAPLP